MYAGILCTPPPPSEGGRKRTDWRQAFNGIIFRLRTGGQWNRLPERFGDDTRSTAGFRRGNRNGVMEKIWAVMVTGCEELDGAHWEWQSADERDGQGAVRRRRSRPQPDGSRQTGARAQCDRRPGRRPVGGGDRRGECP